jgi:hypothetical protein
VPNFKGNKEKFKPSDSFFSLRNWPFLILLFGLVAIRLIFLIPSLNGVPLEIQSSLQVLLDFLALGLIYDQIRKRVEYARSNIISVFPYRALSHTANDVIRKLVTFVNGQNLEELGVIDKDDERWRWIRNQIKGKREPKTIDGQGWWTEFLTPENMVIQTNTLYELLEDPKFASHLFYVVTRLRREINETFGTWAIYTTISENLGEYLKVYRVIARDVEKLQEPLRKLKIAYEHQNFSEKEKLIDQVVHRFWIASMISLIAAFRFNDLAQYDTDQILQENSDTGQVEIVRNKKASETRKQENVKSAARSAFLWAYLLRIDEDADSVISHEKSHLFMQGLRNTKEQFFPDDHYLETYGASANNDLTKAQEYFFGDKNWINSFEKFLKNKR